jgi:hypothetical protein
MGLLIAILIVWWLIRDPDPQVRRVERRLFGLTILGSAMAILDAAVNAGKYQKY